MDLKLLDGERAVVNVFHHFLRQHFLLPLLFHYQWPPPSVKKYGTVCMRVREREMGVFESVPEAPKQEGNCRSFRGKLLPLHKLLLGLNLGF